MGIVIFTISDYCNKQRLLFMCTDNVFIDNCLDTYQKKYGKKNFSLGDLSIKHNMKRTLKGLGIVNDSKIISQ